MQVIFIFVTFCCLAAALQDSEVHKEWLSFKEKYNKIYTRSLEEQTRFIKFKQNLQTIYEHNEMYKNGESSYEMGINKFSDMDSKEMEEFLMDAEIFERNHNMLLNGDLYQESLISKATLPESFDWRETGAITPVKDQKSCGSCWAFSSAGAIEAHHFIKNNISIQLSEQNLVDCVKNNWGCSGGWMNTAFDYVSKNGGINTEASYPYEAINGKCRFNRQHIGATISRYVSIPQGNEQMMGHALVTHGPISFAFYIVSSIYSYKSGIYNPPNCTSKNLHAAIVVGVGEENGQKYWLVKNSWSSSWGDKGYIKMARNNSNLCGIATWASFPVV